MDTANFRSQVWETTLGVRAKLTLLAIGDLSKIEGCKLLCPADVFPRLIPMVGRNLASILNSIKRLEEQKILLIAPSEDGYSLEFHPENEICFTGKYKKRGRL